jgi:hypothetical protein
MTKSKLFLLFWPALAGGAYVLIKNFAKPRRKSDIHLTTQDLDYQNLSSKDLVSDHLTDLNEADGAELQELGLDPQSLERLIENRPYRSKLELVSRMVLTENVYTAIKDKVGVAQGRKPIKVA